MHFDKKTKQIGTAIFVGWFLLTALNSCLGAKNHYDKQMYRLSKAAEQSFKAESPEVMFARLDHHPESVQLYTSLINHIDQQCDQTHNEVSMLAYALNQKNQQSGHSEPLLQTLTNYSQQVDAEEHDHLRCFKAYEQLRVRS